MLYNIKINAGEYTEIAKQGKFLNVVLAAGEIEVRIRLTNNTTFQTQLVSGMAFPVPQGFQSAAFYSATAQQTKVWLSDLPLTYTSLDSRVVGSNAIESTSAKVLYGAPTQLLAARPGRGKSIISASEAIMVGGVGVSPSSAVLIPPNEPFEISTQGALFAYSDSTSNSGAVVVDVGAGNFDYVEKVGTTGGNKLTYCEEGDELLIVDNTSIYRHKAADGTLIQRILLSTFGKFAGYSATLRILEKVGSDYYAFMSGSNGTFLIKYDSITKGYETLKVADGGGQIQDYVINVLEDRAAVLVSLNNGDSILYHGTMTSFTEYATIGPFGSALTMHSGDYIAIYGGIGGQDMMDSTDNGATFSAVRAVGHYVQSVLEDKLTGYIYAEAGTDIMRSNDGITFENVFVASGNIYTMFAAGGYIYATGDSYLYYSADAGITWRTWLLEDLTGDSGLSAVYSMDLSVTGLLYIHDFSGDVYRFGGTAKMVGGLDVAIMSEVN